MEIHVGRGLKRSKTEAMCFPTRLKPLVEGDEDDFEVTEDEGFISFTDSFKYLGAYISSDLRDDVNVEKRIQAASCAFGALTHSVFNCRGIRDSLKGDLFVSLVDGFFHTVRNDGV